ncbi:MAG TPA: hypothetical protein VG817_12345 [Gemmatimonadales bacterium]|nr:hypothetical protein [Gemmatimonadales bacterium]
MSPDRQFRRHEIAVRARAYLKGLIPRSSVLEDVEAADWEDPLMRPLLEVIQNAPKKSRFSGLWGVAYDSFVAKTEALIDAVDSEKTTADQ